MSETVKIKSSDIRHVGVDSVFELEEPLPPDDRLIPPLFAHLRQVLTGSEHGPRPPVVFIRLEIPIGVERAEYLDDLEGGALARLIIATGVVGTEEGGDRRIARIVRLDCAFAPDPESDSTSGEKENADSNTAASAPQAHAEIQHS